MKEGVLMRDSYTNRFFIDTGQHHSVELTCGDVIEVSYLGYWIKARVEFSFERGGYYLVASDNNTLGALGVGLKVRMP